MFLIQEGEVAYVLEGDVAGNPMKPKPGLGTTIPGLPYLSQGSVSGMRMAMEKSSTRDIQNIDSRYFYRSQRLCRILRLVEIGGDTLTTVQVPHAPVVRKDTLPGASRT